MRGKSLAFRKAPKPWRILESKRIASLGNLKLHRDRIVSKTGFEMVHPRMFVDDFSVVIPVLGHDQLVMVWNYRHAIQGWELELPAGHIEKGERPETCAKRELEEETGYSAKSIEKLGWFHPSPGLSPQRAYVFLARNLKNGSSHREPYEVGMEVRTVKLKNAYKMLWRGELVHSPTASALGIAQRRILRGTIASRHS